MIIDYLSESLIDKYPTAEFCCIDEDYSKLDWYSTDIAKPSQEECIEIAEAFEINNFKEGIKAEIDLEFATKSKENITVSGYEYQVSENMLLTLSTLTYPVDWILADNTTVELTQSIANDIIAAVTARVASLKLDARRKKDLVIAMTTQAQLEAVDITVL